MNEEESELATTIYDAMMNYSRNSERGLQAQEFRAGLSDLGYCSERLRRMLNQEVPEETDMLAAFHGTALGEGVEKAIRLADPTVIVQSEIELTLEGDGGTYTLMGHPDIILPEQGILLDAKSANGLELARRNGPDQQKQFQRHTYAKGAWEAGMFGDLPLEEVRVGNVWVDRSAMEKSVHVQLELFSHEIVADAARWLDDVVYAYKQGEPAMKEPAREVCAVTCGYFANCRGVESDVTGLLTDEAVLTALQMKLEVQSLNRKAKALDKEAKALLDGISGNAHLGENKELYSVRWTWVNPSEIESYTRAGFSRLDIKAVKAAS